VTVSFVVTAAPDGVTVAGLNEQLAPAGSPLHAKLTAELNPPCGVTVSVRFPALPELTLSEFCETLNANVGGETN
jgi:hypothetical protein